MDLREKLKLPSGIRWSPAAKRILAHFELKIKSLFMIVFE